MLGTRLLLLFLVVYVSGQGVSYYGGSNVRTQSQLPPQLPGSYRPAYTITRSTQSSIYQPPQKQPDVAQPSPVQRTSRLTFRPPIPDPPKYVPEPVPSPAQEPTVANVIPPQPLYYTIPPQPTMNSQPARPVNGYPRPEQHWNWRTGRSKGAPVEVFQENPSESNNAKVVPAPSIYPEVVDVESPNEPAAMPPLVEEPSVELQPEAEKDELSPQPDLPKPAIPEPLPEIELLIPRPSPQPSPDLRPIPEEPSIDTIPEQLSYPEPIPISNIQPSAIQPEPISALYPSTSIPRPLPPTIPRPSPGSFISPEPESIVPDPAIPVQRPPPIDFVPSKPSYQPTEPIRPDPVYLPPRPDYQPILPPRPSYEPPAPQPSALMPSYQSWQPAPVPAQPQPTPTYPVIPPTPDISAPAPDVLPIIPTADIQCSKGNAYYAIINECDAYIECQKQRAWKHTCPDGLHFNPRASYPEYPCAYPSEVKCVTTASKQTAQPTNECPNRYGFFPISGGDCSRYLMCQEGKATLMNCPFGLVFNDELSSCDWPENVPQCHLSAFKDFSCPIPTEDDLDLITKYRYGNYCEMYLACQHGHPRLLRCDSGLSFDDNSQVCIDSDLVEDCRSNEAQYISLA